MYKCRIKFFRENYEECVGKFLNENIKLDEENIFVGIEESTCNTTLLNYLILLSKVCILKCRQNRDKPSISAYKQILKEKCVEKYIAIKNETLPEFRAIWSGFENNIQNNSMSCILIID